MKLARYKACICEGSAEAAIIDILGMAGGPKLSDYRMTEKEYILAKTIVEMTDTTKLSGLYILFYLTFKFLVL